MGKNILGARVLVMGVTFKEDVSDIRNSKVVDIVNELKDFGVDVDVTDPNADSEEVMHEYGFKLIEKPRANYDAVIVAVAHKEYMDLDEEYFRGLTYEHAVLGERNLQGENSPDEILEPINKMITSRQNLMI